MTISAPIPSPLPSRTRKKESTIRLLAALESLPQDHMLEIANAKDKRLHVTAKRYGFKIRTKKLINGNVGVWRIKP